MALREYPFFFLFWTTRLRFIYFLGGHPLRHYSCGANWMHARVGWWMWVGGGERGRSKHSLYRSFGLPLPL